MAGLELKNSVFGRSAPWLASQQGGGERGLRELENELVEIFRP